ncbi:MAG: hypothetical protein JXD18_04760 [Anaerolineae bacterium]|nr:hypothetical protein [Anaerolineae bacterium]
MVKLLRQIALAAALLAVLPHPTSVAGTPTASVTFQPDVVQVRSGETVHLEVWVADVVDLERMAFVATYDATVLDVLDGDLGRAGVQLEVGPIFAQNCAPENEAGGGVLRFTADRAPGALPFSGAGVAAAVTFRVRAGAAPGTYAIAFDPAAVRLEDSAGGLIAVGELGSATLYVPPSTTAIVGLVMREGTSAHERTAVTAFFYPSSASPPIRWARACTDRSGAFHVAVPPEDVALPPGIALPAEAPPAGTTEWAFVRLSFANHNSECYWVSMDEDVEDIGRHTLEGGDVNGDGCINIYDVVRIIRDFGESAPAPCFVPYEPCPGSDAALPAAPASDINGDCRVDIFDLTITGENFGLCTNCR